MDKTLFKSLRLLIPFWERSSEPWAVKDRQSRFVYANLRVNKLFNLSDKYNLEGRLDGDIPTPAAEFQEEFQRQDSKVVLLQDRVTSVDIQLYDGVSYFTPYFCDKFPLIDENGVCQGVIWHGSPVTETILSRLNKSSHIPHVYSTI